MAHRDEKQAWSEAAAADRKRRVDDEIAALDAHITAGPLHARADDAAVRRATTLQLSLAVLAIVAFVAYVVAQLV